MFHRQCEKCSMWMIHQRLSLTTFQHFNWACNAPSSSSPPSSSGNCRGNITCTHSHCVTDGFRAHWILSLLPAINFSTSFEISTLRWKWKVFISVWRSSESVWSNEEHRRCHRWCLNARGKVLWASTGGGIGEGLRDDGFLYGKCFYLCKRSSGSTQEWCQALLIR